MDWDGPRTQPSFATPSIPALERRLATNSLATQLYRALRLAWVAITFPLHLSLVALSAVPILPSLLPDALRLPGTDQGWTLPQRVVYPLLRRLIWAVCDVGSPGTLTPSDARAVPWWARALEDFTVRVGGAPHVAVEVHDVALPEQARRGGWVRGDVLDPAGVVDFEPVPSFWFERDEVTASSSRPREVSPSSRWSARDKHERVIIYFVGGGFVTGNPSEGSRCFKLARETGLRVVGANFRKATTPSQAFPAALQDALAVYAHVVLELGYGKVLLAGDSAGGSLALMLTQYLATLPASSSSPNPIILPAGLLLISPWSDLTASTYAAASRSRFEDDIICASMATNSIRSFLAHVHSPAVRDAKGVVVEPDSVFARGAEHPFLSPALPGALPSLTRTARAYLDTAHERDGGDARTSRRSPLRILVTTGSAELFHLEVLHLFDNLRSASRAALVDGGATGGGSRTRGTSRREPFEVSLVSEGGEVHAFPLVPEWVSPAAGRAFERIRDWVREGIERDGRER
ncbi:hypothetical protein JCM3775_002378 [Rhodotorula graminis]